MTPAGMQVRCDRTTRRCAVAKRNAYTFPARIDPTNSVPSLLASGALSMRATSSIENPAEA
jgi:hypothetical protein